MRVRWVRVRAAQLFTSLRAGCVLQRVGRGTQVGVRRVAPEQRGGVQRAGEQRGGVQRVARGKSSVQQGERATGRSTTGRTGVRQGGVEHGGGSNGAESKRAECDGPHGSNALECNECSRPRAFVARREPTGRTRVRRVDPSTNTPHVEHAPAVQPAAWDSFT